MSTDYCDESFYTSWRGSVLVLNLKAHLDFGEGTNGLSDTGAENKVSLEL